MPIAIRQRANIWNDWDGDAMTRRSLLLVLLLSVGASSTIQAQILTPAEEAALVAATRRTPITWTSTTPQGTAVTISAMENPTITITLRTSGGTFTGGLLVFEGETGDSQWFPVSLYGSAGELQGQRDESFMPKRAIRQMWQTSLSGWVRFRIRLAEPIRGTGAVAFTVGVR